MPLLRRILNNLVTRDQGGRGEGVAYPPRTAPATALPLPPPSSLAALSVADNVLYVVRQGVVSAPGDAAEGAGGGGAAEAPAGPPKLTTERLAALTKDPLSGLAGLLASQLATSAGTAQYWSRQRTRLEALIRQKGIAPSAFATFSAADLYWEDLLLLLG